MSNLVDFMPLLQHLPTPICLRGKQLHKDLVSTYGGFIEDIDQRLKSGLPVTDCLAKSMLINQKQDSMDDLDMAILASAFMIGGVETVSLSRGTKWDLSVKKLTLYKTASIMQWFMALIPAYPQIQAKAHRELDRVVGRERLPDIHDEKSLPYVRAIIKEVERCHNPF